jgi:hypothetical protein
LEGQRLDQTRDNRVMVLPSIFFSIFQKSYTMLYIHKHIPNISVKKFYFKICIDNILTLLYILKVWLN